MHRNPGRLDAGVRVLFALAGELHRARRHLPDGRSRQPFAAPVSGQTIRDAVAVPGFADGGRFVENTGAETGSGLRLVIVFNPTDERLGFREMCGDLRAVATAAANAAIHIRSAFCQNNESITDASVRGAAGAASAADPAFRTLLDGAVKAALPFFDRQRPTVPGFN